MTGPTERNEMRRDTIDSNASGTRDTGTIHRRRRRLVAGLATTLLLPLIGPAHAGATQTTSRIRLAHFSPDAPGMDVYLVGFDGDEQRVLNGLGFGEVSDYTPLAAGNYTFLLRRAGSPPDSDPWVTASANLDDGGAYTFAAMGPRSDVKRVLVSDDLAPPPAGQAKVRLIQASSSAGEVDVYDSDGWVLAEAAAFGSTTGYAAIPAGPRSIEVEAVGGARVEGEVNFEAGTVNSLVVVEGSGGQPFALTSVVDATGVDVSATGPLGVTAPRRSGASPPVAAVRPTGPATAGVDSAPRPSPASGSRCSPSPPRPDPASPGSARGRAQPDAAPAGTSPTTPSATTSRRAADHRERMPLRPWTTGRAPRAFWWRAAGVGRRHGVRAAPWAVRAPAPSDV
jgi:hypothetical protein